MKIEEKHILPFTHKGSVILLYVQGSIQGNFLVQSAGKDNHGSMVGKKKQFNVTKFNDVLKSWNQNKEKGMSPCAHGMGYCPRSCWFKYGGACHLLISMSKMTAALVLHVSVQQNAVAPSLNDHIPMMEWCIKWKNYGCCGGNVISPHFTCSC